MKLLTLKKKKIMELIIILKKKPETINLFLKNLDSDLSSDEEYSEVFKEEEIGSDSSDIDPEYIKKKSKKRK